jgi:hypothetical protein
MAANRVMTPHFRGKKCFAIHSASQGRKNGKGQTANDRGRQATLLNFLILFRD